MLPSHSQECFPINTGLTFLYALRDIKCSPLLSLTVTSLPKDTFSSKVISCPQIIVALILLEKSAPKVRLASRKTSISAP